MGLILGALAGGGAQLADFADKQIAQDHALDRERYTSDLAQNRAIALEQAKIAMANTERTATVERVQGAAEKIADEKLAPKRRGRDMEAQQDAAGTLVGPMQDPDVVDEQLAQERRGLIDRAMSDGSAGLRTGDITAKDAMGNASKLEINQIKMDNLLARAEDKNATLKEVADVRADAMRYGYDLRLQAAQEKAQSGKIDRATGRMLITSEDANIKASTNQQMMLAREKENLPRQVGGKPNPRLAEIDDQISSLNDEIATSKANKDAYLQDLGILPDGGARPRPGKPAAGAAAAGPAAAPPGLPEGAKQIGTSKGRPVYQLRDGSKVVAQ